MAMRDGDLPATFFASVDSGVWRADSWVMEVIKFAAAIERQQSQKFVGCHKPNLSFAANARELLLTVQRFKTLQPSNHNREAFVCAMTADTAVGKSLRRDLR